LTKKYATDVIQLSEKLGLTYNLTRGFHNRGLAHELEGNLESARTDLIKAVEGAKMQGSRYFETMDEIALGLCEIQLSILKDAESRYNEGVKNISTLDKYLRSLLMTDLAILNAEILVIRGDIIHSDEVYNNSIILCDQTNQKFDLVNCRARYGMSLIRRGLFENGRVQFDEAMKVAKEIGCENRVRLLAKRVGVELTPSH
jgi:tetratricopeptide (TPR) repeat protein